MILNFAHNWLQDPTRITNHIVNYLENSKEFNVDIVDYKKNELFFKEGDMNDHVYILVDGTVELSKVTPNGRTMIIDQLQPGSLVGLISFASGEPVLMTAIAVTKCRAIKLSESEFSKIQLGNSEVARLAQQLIIGNLIDRYHHIVSVRVELENINEVLANQRNHFQEALKQLEETQQRLISQEKMATLGQLVAGIAHEINNPAAAMLRATENLMENLPGIIHKTDPNKVHYYQEFFSIGLRRKMRDAGVQRQILKTWETLYPDLPRSLLRKITSMSDEALEYIKMQLGSNPGKTHREKLEHSILFYECGCFLKDLQSSTNRISEIVSSLKSYSRQEKGKYVKTDLRDGLNDTLLLLSSRLKKIDVILNFSDIPAVNVISGELNQVWTNIIINACDAMEDRGKLVISCDSDDRFVWVSIRDNGPGIHPEILSEIFKPNYTTKQNKTNFGLGLGLPISEQIIQKHGGTINVCNIETGGTEFIVYLPRC